MNCTTIYNGNKKVEVALLHSAECVTNVNRCTTNLPIWFPAQEDKTGGIWHLELEKSIDDSKVNWNYIKSIIGIKMED